MASLSKLPGSSGKGLDFNQKDLGSNTSSTSPSSSSAQLTASSNLVEVLLRNWKVVTAGSIVAIIAVGGIFYLANRKSSSPPPPSTSTEKKKKKKKATRKDANEDIKSSSSASVSSSTSSTQTTPASPATPAPATSSTPSTPLSTTAEQPITPQTANEEVDNRTPEEKASRSKEKGNKYYQAKQYVKAAELYTEALFHVPTGPESHIYYGNRAACYSNLGENEKALEDCNSALKLNPKYGKALSRRANVLETLGRLQEALDDMTACCIFDRFSTPAFVQTADRILKKIAEDKLKAVLDSRVHEMPSPSFITSYLSSFCFQFETPSEVKNEGDEKYVQCLQQMSKANYEESLQSAVESIEKETSYKAQAFNIAGTYYYLMGDMDQALVNFDRSLEFEPNNVNTIIKRASLLFEKKRPEESVIEYQRAISIEPDNSDIYYHRGQVSYLQGDLESSMTDYQRAIELKTTVPFPYIQQAVIHYRRQEIQTSVQLFKTASKKFPQNSDLWNYYGEVLLDQGDIGGAESNFDKALELNPNNALCYINKGVLEWRVKQRMPEAIELMKKAINIDVKCEIAYAQLGQLYQQMSNRDECLEAYDMAIKYTRSEVELSQWISLKEAAASQFRVFDAYPEIPSMIAQSAQF